MKEVSLPQRKIARLKLRLSNGLYYGIANNGEKICRGARMGRVNTLPDDRERTLKLRLERLKWVGGDYDQEGAYWGYTPGRSIYCAWFRLPAFEENQIEVFVRASNHQDAKYFVSNFYPAPLFTARGLGRSRIGL